jgi:hypothetical protein
VGFEEFSVMVGQKKSFQAVEGEQDQRLNVPRRRIPRRVCTRYVADHDPAHAA